MPASRRGFRAAFFFDLCNLTFPHVIAGRRRIAAPESQPAQEVERLQFFFLVFFPGDAGLRRRARGAVGCGARPGPLMVGAVCLRPGVVSERLSFLTSVI